MKLCIPTSGSGGLDDRVGDHFGRVPTYTFVDSETGDVEVIPNESEHRGGKGLPANLLAEEGVDVLLCSGLGRKAINLFDQQGVTVHVGASGTVKEVVEQWQEEKLAEASESDACGRHVFGDRHGDE
ncbi:MAG: NifB/NifX family molybdenum-iron cluster-binding protein [Candidatus Bipolaricaulota bacterium]